MWGGAKGAKGLWWGGVVNGSIQLLESRLRGNLVAASDHFKGSYKHSEARLSWTVKDGKARDKSQLGKFRVAFLG